MWKYKVLANGKLAPAVLRRIQTLSLQGKKPNLNSPDGRKEFGYCYLKG